MKNKLLALGLSVSLLTGCTTPDPIVVEAPVHRSVEVSTIGKDSIANISYYSGQATPSKQIGVVPTIPGKVIDCHYEVGDRVGVGEVLFAIDSTDLYNNMRSLQANYDVAKLSYDNAETTYNNNKLLFDEGIIAQTDMDKLIYACESSAANLATLDVQMEILQKNIDDCIVTSPLSGVISTRSIEKGAFASQSSPSYVIMDLSTVKINIGVSEQVVNSISVGENVSVSISAVSPTPFTGKVATISPTIDETGTYAIAINVANGNHAIKSGMLSEVSFVKESADNTIVLPRSAVITKDDGNYVFVVENNIAKQVSVTTGIETGETIQITSELIDGSQVVTKGQTYLSDGEQVSITDPELDALKEELDGEAEETTEESSVQPDPQEEE